MVSHSDFDAASALVGDGETLCATLLPDGTPRYFVMAAGLSDEAYRDAAFCVRHGRPMSTTEEWALQQATALREAALA